jgi:multicomponent Na+:H+ antiporter subunit C
MDWLVGHYHFVAYVALAMIGLYAMLARGNLVKKIIGLNLLQTAVFLFYIALSKVEGGTVPITGPKGTSPSGFESVPFESVPFENPVPHVLMLTAIVVGVAVTAVALALVVRMKAAYGTIEEDEILAADDERRAREEE